MVSVMEFMLDQVPHMIIQRDEDGTVTYSNSLWREFTGHSHNSPLESHLIHLEDFVNWSRWGNEDAPYFTECRIRRKLDGSYIWHKVKSYFMKHSEDKGYHIRIATDIHNDKLIATQLNESRAREEVYRQLLANSCDPIITFDYHSGMIVNINRAAEREFLYPSVDLVGKSFNLLVPASYSLDGGPSEKFASCMKTSRRGSLVTMGGSEPLMVARRDGERVPVTLSLAHFVIDSQKLCVATLSISTQVLKEQAEIRSSKDSFLRTMSHELRTPLFGLLGTLSTMLEESYNSPSSFSCEDALSAILSDTSPSVLRSPQQSPRSAPFVPTTLLSDFGLRGSISTPHFNTEPEIRVNNALVNKHPVPHKHDAELREMESCTRSLLSVVNNMIAYYKIDLGITPLEMPVQLRTLLQEVCGYYESCVGEGVVFSYEVGDNVPSTVLSDATLLRHALTNLVSNALRFTQKGGVAVVIDVVEPAPSPDKVLLWISVADTGIGIASEFFSQVFQPFTQMDSSNSRKYGGAGLGLAVCKRVVDLLGGAISFNSGLGLGTVFEISLPVSLQVNTNSIEPEQDEIEEPVIESDPITLRPTTPSTPSNPSNTSPRPAISSSPLATTRLMMTEFSDPYSPTSFYDSTPSTYQHQHSQPPSPELNKQESSESDRRTMVRTNSKFQSVLSTIMETETETDAECGESTQGLSNLSLSNRPDIPTPDPNNPMEDYSCPSGGFVPLPPDPPIARKLPASAPASPRIPPPITSPIPPSTRFLRRPSFPFVLDDPSLSLMINNPSPTLGSPSAMAASPSGSPRSHMQSPVSPPNSSSSSLVFPLHMRVLVVDDNLANQNVLKKMLKHMECIVTTAKDGKEALDVLFDENCTKYVGYTNFDLILMDCQMPVMDGFQATQKIREWEGSKNGKTKIRIINLSASGSSETEKQCYQSGSDGFIAKPVTLQSLCRVLAERSARPT